MTELIEFLGHFAGLPAEQWLGLISLAAIGLASLCVWAVHSIAKGQPK